MWMTHRKSPGTTGLFVERVAGLMWAARGHCLLSVLRAKRSHCLPWAWMPTSGLSPRPLQPPLKVHSRVRGSVCLLHGHCVDGGSSPSPPLTALTQPRPVSGSACFRQTQTNTTRSRRWWCGAGEKETLLFWRCVSKGPEVGTEIVD